MKVEDTKYNTLVKKLQNARPSVSAPDLLTDRIMASIGSENLNKSSRTMQWIRIVSSAAAIFLLGLFLFQANENNHTAASGSNSRLLNLKLQTQELCGIAAMSKMQTKKDLVTMYTCYMQKNIVANRMLKKKTENLYPNFGN